MEKAILKNQDGGTDIKFMFNPKEMSFQNSVKTASDPGTRSQQSGRKKVSFSDIPAKTITISNILFDTFETGKDVVENHIKPFEEATRFIKGKQRPPVYCFFWGKQYLKYCFVEQVNYKLTKFKQDGTPVRAMIDSLTLKETEKPSEDRSGTPATKPDRKNDNRSSRSN